jgi:lipoprotein-anchoring transpeptidase ErfK/SrfK
MVGSGLAVVIVAAASTVSFGLLSAESPHGSAHHLPGPPVARATALVLGAQSGYVDWNSRLMVDVLNGTARSVSVTSDGRRVAGQLDGVLWMSSSRLTPLHRYQVTVTYADAANQLHTQRLTVRARDSARHTDVTLSPNAQTVGVGQPAVAYFNHPVPSGLRAAVASRLSVTTAPAVTGAWHWMSGTEVHWRPPTYWKPGTRVQVRADLSGVYLGDGYWGGSAHTSSFQIGDAHVSTVNVARHVMTVTDNGKVIRTIAVSAGRDKYPTKSGVHIALSKAQMVIMDSATVGIPRNSPDGYYEKVFWDVRISNGGAFVHAAPWSVGAQGHRNVSHGCVNISTAEATWFYNFSHRGDVVNIVNSGAPPDTSDAGMSDWNMSWHDWVAGGSVTKSGTSAAPRSSGSGYGTSTYATH